MKRYLPTFLSIVATVAIAAITAWVTMAGRVAALEVRVDERKDDMSQIRTDVSEVRRQVGEIYRVLVEREPR